ncbi:MAG TPA: single-stranded DNA-binding protein [Candidatus Dormibacteraeota bacterium]|jgi:single-strand DNA-binding protein|nr:single-stranded DNA-binding protein [Candidatus Dormibacteraeota bacterium]
MASFNKVILAGNLTHDPELRYTPKGTAVARIRLAINRVYTTDSGEKKEEVTYVDVDAFARQAEVISQYLKKGRPILIEGRLRLETWDDKQTGQKRSKLSVVLESFTFIDSQRSGEGGGGAPAVSRTRPTPAPAAAAGAGGEAAPAEEPAGAEDDVPF